MSHEAHQELRGIREALYGMKAEFAGMAARLGGVEALQEHYREERARLDALTQRVSSMESAHAVSQAENQKLALLIREAVREGVKPLESRVSALEHDRTHRSGISTAAKVGLGVAQLPGISAFLYMIQQAMAGQ